MEVYTYTSLREPEWYNSKDNTIKINSKKDLFNAILYFRMFTPSQKHKFAFEINKQLKNYGIKLKLSKSHPFFKFAQPSNYELTLDIPPFETRVLFELETHLAQSILDDVDFKAKQKTKKFIDKFLSAKDFNGLVSFTEEWFNFMIEVSLEEFVDKDLTESPFSTIATIVDKVRHTLSDFAETCGGNELAHLKINKLHELLIDDIAFNIITEINENDCFSSSQLDDLRLLFTKGSRIKYVMCLREIQSAIILKVKDRDRMAELVDMIEMEIAQTFEHGKYQNFKNFPELTYLPKTVKLLESQRNEHKSYLDIITEYNHSAVVTESFDPNPDLSNIANSLNLNIYPKNIRSYVKTSTLSPINKLILNRMDVVKNIIDIDSTVGTRVSLAYVDKGLCVACDGDSPGTVKLIELSDGIEESSDVIDFLSTEDVNTVPKAFIHTVKVNVKKEDNIESLTEGITIDSDGNIHFKLKKNISYMDQYSENHKVLIQNVKAENWDGVKTNLAVAFTLINEIERKVLHAKKRPTEEKRREAEKARMFLINDFKTYLRSVQKKDPQFNFSEYYESSNLGKLNMTLHREGIVGIKKLVQTLVLL